MARIVNKDVWMKEVFETRYFVSFVSLISLIAVIIIGYTLQDEPDIITGLVITAIILVAMIVVHKRLVKHQV